MSWKSFVFTGVLCVVASPLFAAPTVDAVGGGTFASGHLDAAGNWVWQTRITATPAIVTALSGTPLAAELGFTLGGTSNQIATGVPATKNGAVWDNDNPGTQVPVFGWETLTDVNPSGPPNLRPIGVQTSEANDQVFSALGSINITSTAPQNYVAITVSKPITASSAVLATTTLNLVGAYGGNGRIAELVTATTAANYDTYTGSVTRQAKGGDTDLNGSIAFGDYTTLLNNYSIDDGARRWYHGDFNGDNDVAFGDYTILLNNFGPANDYTVLTDGAFPGGGAGGAAVATPEPASVALLALAALGVAGLRFRKRG